MSFRVRLRFRIGKSLNAETKEKDLTFRGRRITVTALDAEKLRDAKWLAVNARDIPDRDEAISLAKHLKIAILLAATRFHIGVDLGKDLATSAWGDTIRKEMIDSTGNDPRPNVHGVDIFSEPPQGVYITINAEMRVLAGADQFFDHLDPLSNAELSTLHQNALRLLNSATFSGDPVSKLMLAVASVEMLCEKAKWSPQQKAFIQDAKQRAAGDVRMSAAEQQQMSGALDRTYTPGVGEGVRFLLTRLGMLDELWARWDAMYQQRSGIVHGKRPADEYDLSQLATEAADLAFRIVMKAASAEEPKLTAL